jgi:site-specific recombinase XerD
LSNDSSTDWADALDRFKAGQIAKGLSASTIEVQLRRLRRLAASFEHGPWECTTEILQLWLARLPANSLTVKAHRQTIRAFYRWAVEKGHLTTSPAPAPPPVTLYTLDQRWQDALALFSTAEGASHKTPTTIALRVKHVTRLAHDLNDSSPWHLSYEEIRGWLDRLPCTRESMLAHRVSLRAFYRWAKSTGRVDSDPTDEPSRRAQALPVPDSWRGELVAWRTALRAARLSEQTVALYISHLSRFARENASLPPFAVTLDDLIEWLGPHRWAAEYRRNWHNALNSFYRWAEDTDRIDLNPARNLPVVKPGQPRPRPALEHEYQAALSKADDRETLALRMAAELGMRRAEVAGAHSSDVVTEESGWALIVHGKGDRNRTIPLPSGLAAAMRSLPSGYMFPGQLDGHLSARSLGKMISALLPPGVAMHALRHRFATRVYNIDRDVFTTQRLLGHASPATTQRYVLVSDTNMRRLVEAAGQ